MNMASFSEAETFLAIVDSGGFGAAARELGVTQSTVSRRVTALEARIGKRLIERTTRSVSLTEAGAALANDLRDVLARLADAEARAQADEVEPAGLLRVTMPTAYGRFRVAPRLAAIATRYPRLRLEVDLSDRYVDLLEDGFDVAIRIAEPTRTGLMSRRIDRFTLHACASPGYLLGKNPVEHPKDLLGHDCIVQRTYAPRNKWRFNVSGEAIGVDVVPRIVVSDMAAARELVVSGAGVSILPSYLVSEDLAAGRLIELMPAASLPSIEVFASFSHDRRTLSKIIVLVQELEAMGSASRSV